MYAFDNIIEGHNIFIASLNKNFVVVVGA